MKPTLGNPPSSEVQARIQHGRLLKASTIATILAAHGYQSHVVAGFTDEHWSYAIAAARIKSGKASDETKALVIKILRQQEEAKRITVDHGAKRIEGATHG